MMTATNTLNQLQLKMDNVAHNISNVDTTGYKRTESYFNDLLVQQLNNQPNDPQTLGRLTPTGIRQGNGAKLAQAQLVLTQGSLKTTGRSLDLALTNPDQFLTVRVSDGTGDEVRYTRNGALFLSPVNGNTNQLMVVTAEGYPVLDEFNNSMIINGNVTDFTASEKGQITVETAGQGAQTFDLGIVSLKKPQFMEKMGDSLYGMPANFEELGVEEDDILTTLTGGLRNEISMKQGVLEGSNVDLTKEMTDLISVQRQYQFQSRAITMGDQMLGLINSIR
jgi:flagellar basal-body rod protein FlgG